MRDAGLQLLDALERLESKEADHGYWELMGVCVALENPRNQLKRLVAGGGFGPNALTLPFRLALAATA